MTTEPQPRVERGRRRRQRSAAPPIWFSIPFLGMGLLVMVLSLAVMTGSAPGVQVEGSPLIGVLIGGVFAVVGAALLWTSIRERRRATSAAVAGSATPGQLTTERFTRSPMQAFIDLAVMPIGGLGFLGFAVFLVAQGGITLVFAALPAFFGILLLSGAAVTVRRGLSLRIAEVGPSGIWTPELGRLAWSQIAEVRVEDMRGVGGRNNAGTALYRRLGIVPRDPTLAARAPGRGAMGMARGFLRLINTMRPSAGLSDPASLAPFGINASEVEQPFEQVVASVERYMPVGSAGVAPAAPSIIPGVAEALDRSVLTGLPGRQDHLVASDRAGLPDPAPQPARTFLRRSSILPTGGVIGTVLESLGGLTWVVFPLPFLVVIPASLFLGGEPLGLGGLVALLFMLIPLGFLAYGIGLLLQVPARRRLRTGDPRLLTVDADGIDVRGMGRLRWSEIREVRAVDSDRPTGEDSPSIPRLEIIPVDPGRFAERSVWDRRNDAFRSFLRKLNPFGDRRPVEPSFGIDFDLLEGSPDEVLDLIAQYRVVDDRT